MGSIQRKNSRYGFIFLVLFSTLQVLVVTENLFAASIMFLGGTVLATAGYLWIRRGAEANSADEQDNWTGTRLVTTLVVFALLFIAGTLRSLDAPVWLWLPASIIGIGLVLARALLTRHS